MKGIFITGTDTGVGKTHVGVQIARALLQRQVNVTPRKPVESGCVRDGSDLIPQDAQALKNAAGYNGSLASVCPFRFEPAVSPLRAAHLAHQALSTTKVAQACLSGVDLDNEFLLVEGAGGFYSPLCEDGLNADLAQALHLPIVLVADDKLGCINQVLLNVQAIESRKLKLLAVVLNRSHNDDSNPDMNNEEDLRDLVDCPIFSLPYLNKSNQNNIPDQLIDIVLR